MSTFTHVDPQGGVQMVDVSSKPDSVRTAVAVGRVHLGPDAYAQVSENTVRKGDVLAIAQFAGITGAKETSRLIPLCHQVTLSGIDVELSLDEGLSSVEVRAYTKSVGPTGVEMEALTAVSIACLTIYDMCKSITKEIVIQDIHLLAKTGGHSGDYRKPEAE
ncbi:MAG: cyclic pyranopterin monophosphate synthase MoaC [Rhodothermales bacterium]|nr:cyclic pyranopterin monophosphate synthase MoaC [Rhodothermales bacterium]